MLHYLKTGKYLPGSSKKQCKKVEKKQINYVFENEKLYYRKSSDDKTLKIVPRITERQSLIKGAHFLGHFGVDKTYKDLQKNYFWKGMYKDTQFMVSNCMICIRHQKVPVWEHPALSLPIGDVMDRVQIDYIFGLPTTEDGYKGIATYIESCTKFIRLKAIKTKTAEESANNLFEYVSIFGPPKELLSDQGKEFLNETVDRMQQGPRG